MMKNAPRTALALGSGILASVLVLSGCATTSTGHSSTQDSQATIDKAMKKPTNLTFWTWVGSITDEVKLFEKKYPAIHVTVVNAGQGGAEYTKLRTVIKSGQGAPDVAQVEYQELSSFTVTKSLLDVSPYGAASLKSEYAPWVWSQVSSNNAVYGVPQDSGPMGNLYRTDILAKAGITSAPTTWAEYATDAAKVKSATGSYISDLAPNEAGVVVGLLWQAGVSPFGYDGKKTVTIDVNSPAAKKTMAYWQTLIQNNDVAVDPDFTDSWYQGLASGQYAGWLTAAWGPLFLQGTAAKTAGLWRAAPLPDQMAGDAASGNWGGSSDAVLKSSKNPIAAYELAKFINTNTQSALMLTQKQSLFPTNNAVLQSSAFANAKSAFYGGQQVNKLFSQISTTVNTKFEWLPFTDYAYSSFNDTLGDAIAKKGDLSAGLDAWQAALVSYATQQGFTVKQ